MPKEKEALVTMREQLIIDFARQRDGIVLRNKEIKTNKGGTRVTIPKKYLEAGALETRRKYIVVLIPEK